MKGKIIRIAAGITLLMAGLSCFFYPNFREWNTQREVGKIISRFEEIDYVPDSQERQPREEETRAFAELYEEMKQYNDRLIIGVQNIADAWCYEQTPVDLSVLNSEDSAVGYIEIPDMEVRLPLYIGASSENLAKGAAVLAGTSMPIGGTDTNCAIAGHRGWRGSAYFQAIENMHVGSEVYVTNPWETLTYRVTDTKIVDPTEVSAIRIQAGKDMVTLISCHPYAASGRTYRYLVFCERVQTDSVPMSTENVPKDVEVNVKEEAEIKQNDKSQMKEEREEGNLLQIERKLRVYLPVVTAALALLVIFIRVMSNLKYRIKSKQQRRDKFYR